MTSNLLKTGAKNSVTNVNSLTQLYPILRINSIICYHSSKCNLESSVILSCGKCALITTTFIPSMSNQQNFYTQLLFFFYRVNLYDIKLFLNNSIQNFWQISCCEFVYFLINQYTSRRRQCSEINHKKPNLRTNLHESTAHS